MLGATTIVAMEGDANQPAIYSELTVSDAIVSLRREHRGGGTQRKIDIMKVRGSDAMIGSHPFVIDTDGISIFPRFESLVQLREPQWTGRRAKVGIPGIDEMLGGGLTVGTSTVVMGVSGTGKTLLGMQFAVTGAQAGEPGLIVSFNENAVQIRAKARMFGLDLEAAEASGLLRLLILPAFDINVDQVLWDICRDIEGRGVRRLVIDTVAELERGTSALNRTADVLAALTGYLRSNDITSVFTLDARAIVGPEVSIAETPVALVAENLLYLRLAEYRGQLHRLFSVLKMRFSDHMRSIHEYEIRPGRGIELLGAVPPAEGWLTGIARSTWDKGPGNGDL
jgi:circadian clock protein KaiC